MKLLTKVISPGYVMIKFYICQSFDRHVRLCNVILHDSIPVTKELIVIKDLFTGTGQSI